MVNKKSMYVWPIFCQIILFFDVEIYENYELKLFYD